MAYKFQVLVFVLLTLNVQNEVNCFPIGNIIGAFMRMLFPSGQSNPVLGGLFNILQPSNEPSNGFGGLVNLLQPLLAAQPNAGGLMNLLQQLPQLQPQPQPQPLFNVGTIQSLLQQLTNGQPQGGAFMGQFQPQMSAVPNPATFHILQQQFTNTQPQSGPTSFMTPGDLQRLLQPFMNGHTQVAALPVPPQQQPPGNIDIADMLDQLLSAQQAGVGQTNVQQQQPTNQTNVGGQAAPTQQLPANIDVADMLDQILSAQAAGGAQNSQQQQQQQPLGQINVGDLLNGLFGVKTTQAGIPGAPQQQPSGQTNSGNLLSRILGAQMSGGGILNLLQQQQNPDVDPATGGMGGFMNPANCIGRGCVNGQCIRPQGFGMQGVCQCSPGYSLDSVDKLKCVATEASRFVASPIGQMAKYQTMLQRFRQLSARYGMGRQTAGGAENEFLFDA